MNIEALFETSMPTKLGVVAGCSMTRPCECGLAMRPWRLFGFRLEPVDGAPCFFTGSLTLGGCGLPSTGKLADRFSVGNGEIQGGIFRASVMINGCYTSGLLIS